MWNMHYKFIFFYGNPERLMVVNCLSIELYIFWFLTNGLDIFPKVNKSNISYYCNVIDKAQGHTPFNIDMLNAVWI